MAGPKPFLKKRFEKSVPPAEPDLEGIITRLREREAKYRGIFENAIEGIFQTTPDGRFLSANSALARVLGYESPEELLSTVTDIGRQLCVRPETRKAFRRRLEQDGQVLEFENEIYRKDGSIILTSVNARVVRDAAGGILYYEGTSQDITERRRAEVQLATLAHAIESTSEMICITDLQDRFAFVNRAFTLAYGYTPAEILGQTPAILFSPKNPRGLLKKILAQTHAGGWRGEVIDRRKDGSEFPVFLSTSQVRDRTGRVLGLMGIAQDITARKQAETALQVAQVKLQAHADDLETTVAQRTARLREMLDDLHHVSYAMVHDMRAPLRAMRAYAELLADTEREPDPSGTQDYLRRIAAAATRLDKLITDALKYTRVLHEQSPMEPVDLEALIRGLIESYPNLRPELVEISIKAPLPVVLGSEALLTQCFSNLLGNAAKFVEPGTRPQIRVRAEKVQAQPGAPEHSVPGHQHRSLPFVRIWVEDNGIGIPGTVRHRLFGIFERFNTSYEGTGIGLAIVRKVTERMGGSVGVESEEGKGSRFWVQLRSAGH